MTAQVERPDPDTGATGDVGSATRTGAADPDLAVASWENEGGRIFAMPFPPLRMSHVRAHRDETSGTGWRSIAVHPRP